MSLELNINNSIKDAMKAKDEALLRGLRAIKSAILLAKTEKDATDPLSEEAEIRLLNKLAKQRRDSIEIYLKEKREDLAQKEKEELAVIEKYLPQQLSAEELKAAIQAVIAETGATSVKDMGKVMGSATKKLAGKADNKTISAMVQELLK